MKNNSPNATKEAFLTAYKALEELLNRYEGSVYDLETKKPIGFDNAEKLRVCRTVRNYLQHHTGDFVIPSDDMVKFLSDDCVLLVKNHFDVVTMKDNVIKIPAININDTLFNAVDTVSKANRSLQKKGITLMSCPVVEDNQATLGFISTMQIVDAIASSDINIKLLDCFKKKDILPFFPVAEQEVCPTPNLTENVVVTSDGTKLGKYKGVIPYYIGEKAYV